MNKIIQKLKDVKNAESLKARIAKGTFWSSLGNGTEQILRLTRNMILTRILAPEVFGMMAIVLAVNAAFESFTQIGIKEAIVQNPRGQDQEYLNGAWWLAVGRALALYLAVFIGAPYIADFYQNPDLLPLFRVAFLSLLFNGFMSSNAYVAIKQMNFKQWMILYNGGAALGIITAISLGFILNNVWALVIGFFVESFARSILSYIICPFLPRFNFDRECLQALFKYARGMFGLPILTFIFMRADIFVIGKMCSAKELGFYAMAVAMAWMPFQFITMLMGQIMMPAFSEKQDNKELINTWTLKITSYIAYIGFPLLFFVIFYGRNVLTLVYGEQYGAVAVPFAVIFTTALIRTCSVPIATIFLSSGRPELHRLFTGIRAVLIMAMLYPAILKYGLIGAAGAGLISMVISFIFQTYRLKDVTGILLRPYYLIFLKGVSLSSCVIILWASTNLFLEKWPMINMIPGILGCIVAYGIAFKYFSDLKVTIE